MAQREKQSREAGGKEWEGKGEEKKREQRGTGRKERRTEQQRAHAGLDQAVLLSFKGALSTVHGTGVLIVHEYNISRKNEHYTRPSLQT